MHSRAQKMGVEATSEHFLGLEIGTISPIYVTEG